jgi:hypothetical protein
MPKKSKKYHNFLLIVSAFFAVFLIASSFWASIRPIAGDFPLRMFGRESMVVGNGLVAGVSSGNMNEAGFAIQASVDVASWKIYRDPIYNFTLKYPSEWADPIAKKINDPDFDYQYQVSFGTAETLTGNGGEGFSVFVFPTPNCSEGQNQGGSGCATVTLKTPAGSGSNQNIFEFQSQVYSYTIVPAVIENDPGSSLVKAMGPIADAAQKTFVLDPALKLIQQKKEIAGTPAGPAPSKDTKVSGAAIAVIGRVGKLTGAVRSGGKMVCPHPNHKPQRSPNKGNHVDEDCCPDPDEYPNAACAYKPSDYAIMLRP